MRVRWALLVLLSGCTFDPFDKSREQALEGERDALRTKVAELQLRLDAMEAKRSDDRDYLASCIFDADDSYWAYVELNGGRKSKTKPGIWHARQDVFMEADRKKEIAIAKCKALYGQ